jgi:hypothetical protein
MAGTLTISTLSDGTNSTSSTNCIQGSAKAWLNMNGSTPALTTSYNISSITRNATGQFQVNITNALTDANYSCVGTASIAGSTFNNVVTLNCWGATVKAPTSSIFYFTVDSPTLGAQNPTAINFALFR